MLFLMFAIKVVKLPPVWTNAVNSVYCACLSFLFSGFGVGCVI